MQKIFYSQTSKIPSKLRILYNILMSNQLILAIDTSCDETSAAVTLGRKVASNIISSQVSIHSQYGGVFPALAKRAHEEKIDFVVQLALKKASQNLKQPLPLPIFAVAVTHGPGLAIALEVGIKKAKQLLKTLPSKPKLIAVNHLEGHIYSCLAQNLNLNPKNEFFFPALCLIVSGGHTELVLMKDHCQYQTLGATLDDACGEALDKAAKILKLGYPGGPIIEALAEKYPDQKPKFLFKLPLREKSNLDFSYSGLKTQFLYLVESLTPAELGKNIYALAHSFQYACFEQIIRKTSHAIQIYQPKTLVCGGGVIANHYLRKLLRSLAKKNSLPILFPPKKELITDNAAMIGVAAYFRSLIGDFVKNPDLLDRIPRLSL